MTSGSNPNVPPEERYSTQLDALSSMGFVNREANLQGMEFFANLPFTRVLSGSQLTNLNETYSILYSINRYIRRYKCSC